MFPYYFELALRSLRRNAVLTTLMVSAIGVGIGASMTTLTVIRAMSGGPIWPALRAASIPPGPGRALTSAHAYRSRRR